MLLVTKKPAGRQANQRDVYVFDCMGLVVLRNVVPAEQIQRAREAVNRNFPKEKPWKFSTLGMGDVFWDILNNRSMLEMAEQLCGDQFRLDHAFGVSSDAKIVNLHGGPASSYGSCFTKVDGQLCVGQLSCGIPLTAQSPATGGMCYIPGSHRSVDVRSGSQIRREVFNGSLDQDCIVVPTLNVGDLVIFSESLVHGDNGWNKPDEPRLTLYYKFSPGYMTWRDARQQEQFRHLARTEQERRLLEPPWSGGYGEDNFKMDHVNKRKDKTLLNP